MILMGTAYWRPLIDLLHRMVVDGAIASRDLDLLFVTDSVEEAIHHLERNAIDRFALRAPKPSRWLGESAPAVATPSVRP
jgi:predicted Rossmann-fold nucleotide-binding protein